MRDLYLKQGVIVDERGETPYSHQCSHFLNHSDTPHCRNCNKPMSESDTVEEGFINSLKFRWFCRNPECSQKRHSAQAMKKITNYELSKVGVPEILCGCTIENFQPRKNIKTGKNQNLQKNAYDFSRQPKGTILMTGTPGTGKSHLAVGILREYMVHGSGAYFKRTAELLIELQATYKRVEGDTAEMLLGQYRHYRFLILDDLGSEKPTDYAVMILGEIINARYQDNKPTIITSNLGLQEINDRLDPRIASRITKPEWRFNFEDYRK